MMKVPINCPSPTNATKVDVTGIARGEGKFSRICSHDGKVYLAPSHSDQMLVFDPVFGQCTGVDVTGIARGKFKFSGICSHEGKVYLAPYDSDQMLVFDPAIGQCQGVDVTGIARGESKFSGICSHEGKVYLAPAHSDQMLVVEPAFGGCKGVDVTGIARGKFKFSGICSHDGKVYLAPYHVDQMLVFDPAIGQCQGVDVTGIALGEGKFNRICSHDGKVYLAPFNSDQMLVFDPAIGQCTGVDVKGIARDKFKFSGICSHAGKVYLAPYNSDQMLVFDPATGQCNGVDVTGIARGKFKFSGICSHEGNVYLAPRSSDRMLVLGARVSSFMGTLANFRFEKEEEVRRMKERHRKELEQLELKARREVRVYSEKLGVSARYLLESFSQEARAKSGEQSPSFYTLSKVMAIGETGKGFGMECPRDSKPNCSIVDALPCSRPATHFVSWCWAYKLEDFLSALENVSLAKSLSRSSTFFWICFFTNNQYRILEEKSQTGVEKLKGTFEQSLASIGEVIVVLDSFHAPKYITRVWCVFESYVAVKSEVPVTYALADAAEEQFTVAVNKGMAQLRDNIASVDVQRATATFKGDEKVIKRLIAEDIGFETVNKTVKKHMAQWAMKKFSEYLQVTLGFAAVPE